MKKIFAVMMLLVFATSAAFAANEGVGLAKKPKKHKKDKQSIAAAQASAADKKAADQAKNGIPAGTVPVAK